MVQDHKISLETCLQQAWGGGHSFGNMGVGGKHGGKITNYEQKCFVLFPENRCRYTNYAQINIEYLIFFKIDSKYIQFFQLLINFMRLLSLFRENIWLNRSIIRLVL